MKKFLIAFLAIAAFSFPAVSGAFPYLSGNNYISASPVVIYPRNLYSYHGIVPIGSTTLTITPKSNASLIKLIIGITEDGRQATAGDIHVTVTLNGTNVYDYYVYVPSSAGTSAGTLDRTLIDFYPAAANSGLNGVLTVTLSAPLTGGTFYVNAFFDM